MGRSLADACTGCKHTPIPFGRVPASVISVALAPNT